jgi:hypothetical protein
MLFMNAGKERKTGCFVYHIIAGRKIRRESE